MASFVAIILLIIVCFLFGCFGYWIGGLFFPVFCHSLAFNESNASLVNFLSKFGPGVFGFGMAMAVLALIFIVWADNNNPNTFFRIITGVIAAFACLFVGFVVTIPTYIFSVFYCAYLNIGLLWVVSDSVLDFVGNTGPFILAIAAGIVVFIALFITCIKKI